MTVYVSFSLSFGWHNTSRSRNSAYFVCLEPCHNSRTLSACLARCTNRLVTTAGPSRYSMAIRASWFGTAGTSWRRTRRTTGRSSSTPRAVRLLSACCFCLGCRLSGELSGYLRGRPHQVCALSLPRDWWVDRHVSYYTFSHQIRAVVCFLQSSCRFSGAVRHRF